MSLNNKEIVNMLDKVLNELKDIKQQGNVKSQQLNLFIQKQSDMSSKLDILLNDPSAKTKSATKVKGAESTTKPNKWHTITAYFKDKYCNDIESISHLLDDDECEQVCNTYSKELGKKNKKDLANAKAGYIYKCLIKDNKEKVKILRSLKERDESNSIVIDPEITEISIEDVSERMDTTGLSDEESD